MNKDLEKLSYTFDEAQLATGISSWTWRRLARKKLIQVALIGKRILVPASELRRIVASGANSGPIRGAEHGAGK